MLFCSLWRSTVQLLLSDAQARLSRWGKVSRAAVATAEAAALQNGPF